jgi:hypothetical protein
MRSSESARALLASLGRQKRAVAGLVLMALFYVAFLVGMKLGGVGIVQRVHRLRAEQLARQVEAHAQAMPSRPSAALPLEWDLPRLGQHPHTAAIGFVQEDYGLRTDSVEATLLVNLGGPVTGDLELTADARPHLHRKNLRQEVEVRVGGEPVARWSFAHKEPLKTYTARVPARLVRPGEPLRLTFHLPGVDAPKAIHARGGSRLSGIELLRLRLDSVRSQVATP